MTRDDEPAGEFAEHEWWSTIELSPEEKGPLVFIDRSIAENFALYLVADGVETVLIAHWRGGRCVGLEHVRPPG